MNDSNVVTLFDTIDEATLLIQEKLNETYLDSLSLSLEVLHHGNVQETIPDGLQEETVQILDKIELTNFNQAEIRRAIQLVILKGMQKTTQHQHVITPDSIALFIGYLAEKLLPSGKSVRIFDPVSGTGNLLLTVMNYLKQSGQAYACEIDVTLLKISLMFANIMEREVEFFHQDSLRPFLLDPVDLIVADLPVGYYPDDIQAGEFELQAKEGHSFSHYLLIEQSIEYTKEEGIIILLIPETLFVGEQSEQLHAFIQQHAHVVGLIQLDEATFKSEKSKKSILILQKRGEHTKDVKQPLMAKLPSFKNTNAMEDIMSQINQWFQESNFYSRSDQ